MRLLGLVAALLLAFPAAAQEKVILGMSGWTGFQPLKLAELGGIFKKNGVDIEIRFIAPVQRSAALASGALNAAATTVDQHIVWTSAGIPTVQVALIDKSKGGDGLAVRNSINSIKELKGKSVNVDGPGTVQHFMLSYILEKNGMSMQDVIRSTMAAQPAAQAFVAGQGDAALTYEPYLSAVREKPEAGRIIATTLDYPMIMDTFGCTPSFLEAHPEAAKALADSYFAALEMIAREPEKAYGIMGADVKQTAEQFGGSAKYLRWQDREAVTVSNRFHA
jgi:NitT/TauT family transport system substrate-binding protein